MAESQSPAADKCVLDALNAVGFTRVHCDGHKLRGQVVECQLVSAGRETRLGPSDVEPNDSVIAVTNRQLSNF